MLDTWILEHYGQELIRVNQDIGLLRPVESYLSVKALEVEKIKWVLESFGCWVETGMCSGSRFRSQRVEGRH
jgi:hypothetical protein